MVGVAVGVGEDVGVRLGGGLRVGEMDVVGFELGVRASDGDGVVDGVGVCVIVVVSVEIG
jgi:hypothetical protein